MTSLQQIYDDFVRALGLTWQLDDISRRRLMLASAVPALVIAAQLTETALTYVFGRSDLYYPGLYGDGAGEFWERLYRASTTLVQTLVPVALALLFLAGIRSWTRAEGSYALLAGAGLASCAALLAMITTLALTATEDVDLLSDLGTDEWFAMARTFGLLSIGFFFVAHRGLSSHPDEPPASVIET